MGFQVEEQHPLIAAFAAGPMLRVHDLQFPSVLVWLILWLFLGPFCWLSLWLFLQVFLGLFFRLCLSTYLELIPQEEEVTIVELVASAVAEIHGRCSVGVGVGLCVWLVVWLIVWLGAWGIGVVWVC